MNERLALVLAWAEGGLLGAIFFGSLWWTVRRGLSAKLPALWFSGSALLRTSVAVLGLYLASGGRWERMLACLLGFAMASIIVTRVTRPSPKSARPPGQEGDHAPYS